jgi:hypothetical protein
MEKENKMKEFKEKLDTDGYVVIPNVLSSEEAEFYKNEILKFLCSLNKNNKLKYDDIKTWTSKDWPFNLHGIIKHFGIGHCQAIWDLRANQRVNFNSKKSLMCLNTYMKQKIY